MAKVVNAKFPCCNRGGRLPEEAGTYERKCKCRGPVRKWEVTLAPADDMTRKFGVPVLRAEWKEKE